jgi:hypothetical protein
MALDFFHLVEIDEKSIQATSFQQHHGMDFAE